LHRSPNIVDFVSLVDVVYPWPGVGSGGGRSAGGSLACHNVVVVNKSKKPYVDHGWPSVEDGGHAVTELSSTRSGGLSPFGEDTEFPLPADQLPYMHPNTVINR